VTAVSVAIAYHVRHYAPFLLIALIATPWIIRWVSDARIRKIKENQ
jgi:hypothetical protein